MNRRRALTLIAAAPLAACQATSGPVVVPVPVNLPEWVKDLKLVADGLAGVLPLLAPLGLSAATTAEVQAWLARLEQIADAAVAAVPADGKATVGTFVQAAAAVVSVLSGVDGLPSSVTSILVAAQALLPIIQIAVGFLMTPRGSPMAPAQARAVLAAARRQ